MVEELHPPPSRATPVLARPRRGRRYGSGDEALDAAIAALLEQAGVHDNADLLAEIIATALRFGREGAGRGEVKLANTALKELRYAFKVFAPYRGLRKAAIFGSARATADDPDYAVARDFSRRIAEHGWMVITGAGSGIMQAGHEGAGPERSFGVNIRLPFEQEANPVIGADPKLINFKYFFTRKVTFLKESDAFVLLPGGFGTLDETFELLTLMQTGKSDLHPVVLLEAPGGSYWAEWREFIEHHLVRRGLISPEDLGLLYFPRDVSDAVAEVTGFYRNYHSQRFVDGRLVLRLHHAPGRQELGRLTAEFGDILGPGGLEVIPPTPAEVEDNDALELKRIALAFNRESYGRLRQLVDALNRL